MLIARKLEWLGHGSDNSISGSSILKFDDVVSVILNEEMRRKSIGETSGNTLTVDNRVG